MMRDFTKLVQILFDFIIGILFLASCVPGTGSESFRAPEILSADAELSWKAATLHCRLSDGRAERVGFLFESAEGSWQDLSAELQERSFDVFIEGLVPGRSYRYLAYAEAGESRIETDTLSFTAREALPTDPITVEDPVFKDWLLARFDRNQDGEISFSEAESVRSISIAPTNRYNLQSLQGIEYMPNLEEISCGGEWYDVGEKTSPIDSPYYFVGPYRDAWETVWGPIGTLRSVDVRHNPKLRILNVHNNSGLGVAQDVLDISGNPLLEELNLAMTWLRYPDLTGHPRLQVIDFAHIRGEYPDLQGLPELRELTIDFRQDGVQEPAMDVDVSGCPKLEHLSVSAVARSLSDLTLNPHLKFLHVAYCGFRTLDVSGNAELEDLDCSHLGLDTLDLSGNPKLLTLRCSNNRIRTLDLTSNLLLGSVPESGFWCPEMRYGTPDDVLETIYVAQGQVIPFVTVDRSDEHVPPGTQIVVKSDKADIEDPVFKDWLLARFDRNQDGEISFSEAESVRSISIAPTNRYNLQSLQGIEYMPNLEEIECWGDWVESGENGSSGAAGTLRSLDVSHNPALQVLNVHNNEALGVKQGRLDLSGHPSLWSVDVHCCGLQGLDMTDCPELRDLTCYSNALKSIDVAACPRLRLLSIADNDLETIDVTRNPELTDLAFNGNRLSRIDLSCCPGLRYLSCWHNNLSDLDLSANPALRSIRCWGNLLRTLDVSRNLHLGEGEDADIGLQCQSQRVSPMETLYVALGQVIPFVTENRDDRHISPETAIVVKPNPQEFN